MRFAPFGFESNSFWNTLTLNYWQGNYVASGTTWTNSVPGGPTATTTTMSKVTFGVQTVHTGITISTITSDGKWDANPAGTLVIYMNITDTINSSLWSKQTAGSNGMGVDFTNNPLYLMRAPGSGNQVQPTSNTSRGQHVYSFATDGGNDQSCQYYIDKVAPAMTRAATINTSFNNGKDLVIGYKSGGSWTDPSTAGVINRIMFFNSKLDSGQIAQVVDYCTQNQ